MEYSVDGGIYWMKCPEWKIENLAPAEDCRVRFKAVEGVSFAGMQAKLVIKASQISPEVCYANF
jgi:hypothetical protein